MQSVFSLIMLSICIISIEVFFQTTHIFNARRSWYKADAVLGWRFIPHRTYWYAQENDHPITGKINNLGWRDKKRTLAKPLDTYRIAVLGDSYVEAVQVELERTFLSIAESALGKKFHRSFEVLNFERSGFTQTEQYWLLTHEIIHYSPDMVIICFLPSNDIADMSYETAENKVRPFYEGTNGGTIQLNTDFTLSPEYRIKSFVDEFRQRSALFSLIINRLNILRARQGETQITRRELEGYLTLCTSSPNPIYKRNYEKSKYLIEKMLSFCKEEEIVFVLMGLDDVYATEDIEYYVSQNPSFNPSYFDSDLALFSQSQGIEYIGLQAPFQHAYLEKKALLHFENLGHWNYNGHKLVAETILQKLHQLL